MSKLLALVSVAFGFAAAQDMTAAITSGSDASDSGLLAYTTITTACLPAVDPNNEPIFSIQTDTSVESCTYVVNADNYSQVVSTIGAASTTASDETTTSSSGVPLSTIMGTNTASMSGPPITTSTTISTDSSATTNESTMSETTTLETTAEGADEPSATSQPAETATDGAAGRNAMGGEALGVVGLLAVLAAL